jgi:RNA polymerase-binding transcription factor DksA
LNELEQMHAEEQDALATDMRDTSGDLSTVDQHPADTADVTFQRELQLTTANLLEREAEQAREALRMQDEGRYGECLGCGQRIPEARLRARPEATLCVGCQREREGST